MVNSHFLKRIISVGEKEILARLTDYADLSYKATDILIFMMKDCSSLVERNEEVKEIEKVGDELNISIKQDITKGNKPKPYGQLDTIG
ncbi:TVG0064976 [Thermoplasma volcanium GSS1]|uniref:TVG0064976 protein n=1 Tax=Thermoplasma volcanium (strain ATCC 51530 / DSM 4299 / JCM 9571 / NBRC 15438 / GSS1) TaxID=273116 RepID=Q97CN8_THEVO|nr:hypothetical protein [Thermoplasma volcanium]BAB59205.1 TVG0064976 [Thermoplasma volcanium GSS1]